MKTCILVMCLLAVAYANTNPKGLKTLHKNIKECKEKLPQCGNLMVDPVIDVYVWFCALKRVHVINKEDKVVKEKGVGYCEDVMTENNVKSCEKTVGWCIDTEGEKSGSNEDISLAQIACVIKYGVMSKIEY
ncbi:PREDICTED: venom allergen 2-like [Cyphomyrmex costatus]|uniref:Venom allergen 2 n=1 Tax=Cyphomyrmex costatus TaxID=456900 RepID=A0A195CNP7_9HYME|nr:PREDICTED: venom allergen 2-like [Cyphomyrmex costatus]KYN01724.1 Venom allergen 2 [Cyphomyrmex costatus]